MKAWVGFILIMAAFVPAFVPTALSHSCGGTQSDCTCPIPSDGKAHSHAGPGGSCSGAGGAQASATPGGASATPGAPLVLVLLVVALAAVGFSRRG
jgi:hypothetical protein